MSLMMLPSKNICQQAKICLLALALSLSSVAGWAAETPSKLSSEALKVLADLTLIDNNCRDVSVNFGIGFRFAEAHGLDVSTIMPSGAHRAEFERTLQARQTSFDRDDLCGSMSSNYADALPGSVTGQFSHAGVKP